VPAAVATDAQVDQSVMLSQLSEADVRARTVCVILSR
jgi:hypothetical protein